MEYAPKPFSIAVAATVSRGIGISGGLPWCSLPTDMKFFKEITSAAPEGKCNAVIMGRITYNSLPNKFRPLPNRLNVLLSRNSNAKVEQNIPDSVLIYSSLQEALHNLSRRTEIHKLFIIGGGAVFHEALGYSLCETIYYTRVLNDIRCTVFFDEIDPDVYELTTAGPVINENQIQFQFLRYDRKTQLNYQSIEN